MRRKDFAILLLSAAMVAACFPAATHAEEPPQKAAGAKAAGEDAKDTPAPVKPKPLSDTAKKGLAYLANQQHEDGGWGQGGGWRIGNAGRGRVEGAEVSDPSDVGNTCVALLALIRSGSTPKKGPYAKQIFKGLQFVTKHIEQSDNESLYVTSVRNTQLQSKIGAYADTFFAALLLAEVKGEMASKKWENRLASALDKTIGKIERHQNEDGEFTGNHGWASVLSLGVCGKALNRAAQKGVAVKQQTLERDAKQAVASLKMARPGAPDPTAVASATPAAGPRSSARSGFSRALPVKGLGGAGIAGGASDAGVPIYNFSANAGRLQDLANTNVVAKQQAEALLENSDASEESKTQAQQTLAFVRRASKAQQVAVGDLMKRLDDPQFIAGFGNNGGEEFLSYMNISETLVVKGGQEWKRWDGAISQNINRVQNDDGSWSGHHCITGRTFCTATALLTLMGDRAPLPVATKLNEKRKGS